MTSVAPSSPALVDRFHRHQLAVAVVGGLLTLAMLVEPTWRVEVHAPILRIPFEVLGASVVLFAAVILGLPEGEDVQPARSAYLSGLLVLAVSNVWLAAQLAAGGGDLGPDLQYWPWVGARYLVSVFFVLAGLERPRASLRRYLVVGVASWIVLETAILLVPLPVATTSTPGPLLLTVQLVPALLFGLGSVLAARLHRRRRAPEYAWLSLALEVQVLAQLHEVVAPAFTGPYLTSADALRLGSFLLLLAGSVEQLRRLYRERSEVIRLQQDDLSLREDLVERLGDMADREADFRAIVSHELASPIAAIRACVHVLDRHLAPRSRHASTEEAMTGLRTEARRLTALVNRMDELRNLEHTDFRCDLRPVLLGPVLEDALVFARSVATGHTIELRAEPARVLADPVRLSQVLRNVLANAIRYAPAGTGILVEGAPSGPARYALRISDEGPGVPPGERAEVRQRFVRGSRAGPADGRGVGLYLVDRIMQAHGGQVAIASAPSGGAAVVLELRRST